MENTVLDQIDRSVPQPSNLPFWRVAGWRIYLIWCILMLVIWASQKGIWIWIKTDVENNVITAGNAIIRAVYASAVIYTLMAFTVGFFWARQLAGKYSLPGARLFAAAILPALTVSLLYWLILNWNNTLTFDVKMFYKMLIFNMLRVFFFGFIVTGSYLYRVNAERWKPATAFLAALFCVFLYYVSMAMIR